MANVSLWSNVQVAIESALGSPQVIDTISKASPGVVTYQGADPTNGGYVKILCTGMNELNGRVVRVANVNTGANTFELEGISTVGFGTFSAGTIEPVTFGVTMTTAAGLSASGGDFSFVDTTTIHDTIASQIPGVAQPAVYTFESFWDVSDAALIALKLASDTKAQKCVRFTFANGQKVAFVGYIGASLLPVGNAQDKVTTTVAVTMFGKPSVFAS